MGVFGLAGLVTFGLVPWPFWDWSSSFSVAVSGLCCIGKYGFHQVLSPRPPVTLGFPIGEYMQRQPVALSEWVLSDNLLRTDDELLRELRQELGFLRGGSRINPTLMEAIGVARSRMKQ